MDRQEIEFLRKKSYEFVKNIGGGGFGKTILLRDPYINQEFVCKKYDPLVESNKEIFYDNFVNEIKFLHLLNDRNIVRVYNYYLYPEKFTGYVLMEYIDGDNIEKYIKENPDKINDVFTQVINAFVHLEELKVLHRDIRPFNIMVAKDGTVKIIDFGFGKQIIPERNFDKSISLNWYYQPPEEFVDQIYDFKTEIYFVGKLIEDLIAKNEIISFAYTETLRLMIQPNYDKRVESFLAINRTIFDKGFEEINFNYSEKQIYQHFAINLIKVISSIQQDCKYVTDLDELISQLDKAYKNSMLEALLQNNALIASCFLKGACMVFKKPTFPTSNIKNFLEFFKSLPVEKKKIVLNNIWQRLDAFERKTFGSIDDLPF